MNAVCEIKPNDSWNNYLKAVRIKLFLGTE